MPKTLTPATLKQTAIYKEACDDGKEWLDTQPDLETAWNNIHRIDWAIWLLRRSSKPDTKDLVSFAVWCVRHTPLADGRKVWDLLTDQRSRDAIDTVERWCNGEPVTQKELDAAADAASAASAVYATHAAADAVYAAHAAAYVASAVYAAHAAADAVYATHAAADAVYAAAGAAHAAVSAQIKQLHAMFPNPFVGNAVAPAPAEGGAE